METQTLQTTPIAIIGTAGIFAQAHNVQEYWEHILHKVDCITDVPPSRWDIDAYYDPDPSAPDKTYCKRGGFIPDIDFNPMEFGLPPNILEVTDVSQLLALVVARDLLAGAGYGPDRDFDRSRVGVILGVAGGQKLITPLSARLQYPVWERVLKSCGLSDADTRHIVEKMKLAYVEWNENAFPGLLGNVIAGRIANRFDLGGINCVVDAACASSLSAVKLAVSQLLEGQADLMITGGVDTDNSPFMYMCFSKTPAFTPGPVPRPFDADADGMMVGEGLGMVLLKRLADAERDGDTIYAVIRGIGASSDGRYKSIYAPRPEGQALAMRRAYAEADLAPQSVGLIEAHGTGTRAGDPAEIAGLRQVFGNGSAPEQPIAMGSVKSQIGHTKAAAGAAGLIKAALALHHRVLPPTINVTRPTPELDGLPFYVNTEARPWIPPNGTPRRAGVSAFGFGGTNFHVVLEEHRDEHRPLRRLHRVAQPVLLHAETPAALQALVRRTRDALGTDRAPGALGTDRALAELNPASVPPAHARLGFVALDVAEARDTLALALTTLEAQPAADAWEHPKGIFYRSAGVDPAGGVVALFPGQGAQYPNMGRELVINVPELQDLYRRMDALFVAEGLPPLSSVVFPPPAFDEATAQAQAAALRATDYAQAAIGVFSAGLFTLLRQAGFTPDFTAGHSFGELTALWAGGVLSDADFLQLVKARGRAMAPPDDPDFDAGGMLAVKGPLDEIEAEVANATAFSDVTIANQNSPSQVVLAGPTDEIRRAHEVLGDRGYKGTLLPVSAAFHTPLVGHASEPFAEAVAQVAFHPARIPVYANTTGAPYPDDPKAARELLARHILNPVYFKRQIDNLYAAGGRYFVEFGPRRITTNLVQDTLADRPHVAVSFNSSRQKPSDRQFREALVQLRVAGLALASTSFSAPKPERGRHLKAMAAT
jgi:polyketide-type polyunsaturated fatty acid synthase PfaA